MVRPQNIILIDKLSRNEIYDAIQSTFAVDFFHNRHTRADDFGFLNLPQVEITNFGKHLITYNALLSWHFIQFQLP